MYKYKARRQTLTAMHAICWELPMEKKPTPPKMPEQRRRRRRLSSPLCTRTLMSIPSVMIEFVKHHTSPARFLTKHVHDLVRHHNTHQAVAISTTRNAVVVMLGPNLPRQGQSRHDLDQAQVGP